MTIMIHAADNTRAFALWNRLHQAGFTVHQNPAQRADYHIVLISEAIYTNTDLQARINAAIERNQPIIPLIIDGGTVPAQFQSLDVIDWRDPTGDGYAQLVARLRALPPPVHQPAAVPYIAPASEEEDFTPPPVPSFFYYLLVALGIVSTVIVSIIAAAN